MFNNLLAQTLGHKKLLLYIKKTETPKMGVWNVELTEEELHILAKYLDNVEDLLLRLEAFAKSEGAKVS